MLIIRRPAWIEMKFFSKAIMLRNVINFTRKILDQWIQYTEISTSDSRYISKSIGKCYIQSDFRLFNEDQKLIFLMIYYERIHYKLILARLKHH